MPAARSSRCPEGFPLGQTGPPRAGFLGTKNTSGYTDQGTAGLVKTLIKCREIPACNRAGSCRSLSRRSCSDWTAKNVVKCELDHIGTLGDISHTEELT